MTSEVLAAFRDEAVALDGVVDGLDGDDFDRPTNCPPWTVKELIVHVAVVLPPRGAPPDAPAGAVPLDGAADVYYRRPERRTPAYHDHIAQDAVTRAADLPDGPSAGRWLTKRWRSALEWWSSADLDRLVSVPVGVMRLGDYVVTRLISHAAHGLDLAPSLGRRAWTASNAVAAMRPTFVALLGGEPPRALGWSDQAFFERATGRRPLADVDRTTLDGRADLFPLVS